MPSVTLTESAKLAREELIAGVIRTVVNVDQLFQVMPFHGISGNALAYVRENVRGDVQYRGVGDSITATNPATFTKVTSSLTTLIGQAEVNQLIQETRSEDGNDQTAIQIESKARSCGDQYRDSLINGTGAGDEFTGLLSLCAVSQKIDTGANGTAFDFDILDELIDKVKDKNGRVDYFCLSTRTRRSYFRKLRALGGAGIGEVVTLPSGDQIPAYRGVPLFANDNMPIDQVKGGSSDCTSILAGTFDDGSMKIGIAGLTARRNAGMGVEDIGPHQTKDERLYRVKWYCGLALFNELGLAMADGIRD
jgi:HK97 family phage major capsid protein